MVEFRLTTEGTGTPRERVEPGNKMSSVVPTRGSHWTRGRYIPRRSLVTRHWRVRLLLTFQLLTQKTFLPISTKSLSLYPLRYMDEGRANVHGEGDTTTLHNFRTTGGERGEGAPRSSWLGRTHIDRKKRGSRKRYPGRTPKGRLATKRGVSVLFTGSFRSTTYLTSPGVL